MTEFFYNIDHDVISICSREQIPGRNVNFRLKTKHRKPLYIICGSLTIIGKNKIWPSKCLYLAFVPSSVLDCLLWSTLLGRRQVSNALRCKSMRRRICYELRNIVPWHHNWQTATALGVSTIFGGGAEIGRAWQRHQSMNFRWKSAIGWLWRIASSVLPAVHISDLFPVVTTGKQSADAKNYH